MKTTKGKSIVAGGGLQKDREVDLEIPKGKIVIGFAGVIDGANVNLVRVGGNTLTLEAAQTYGGATIMMGGTLALENDATLLSTSSLVLNYAGLSLNNNSSLQTQINDRIGDAIPILMNGGTITVNGRLTTNATETLGALTVAQGANVITATTGGGTFTGVDLTIASLTRSAGATINFTGTNLLLSLPMLVTMTMTQTIFG